jgi:hypothetical protein
VDANPADIANPAIIAYPACGLLILVYAWGRFNTPPSKSFLDPPSALLVKRSGLYAERAAALCRAVVAARGLGKGGAQHC